MVSKWQETIAAISTPPGEGGISLIRISGPDAHQVAGKVFRGKKSSIEKMKSHTVRLGEIVDERDGRIIDEVLLTWMKGPRSYTGEDVIEIGCHGGVNSTTRVLESILRSGCRLAEPGEFTKRAFLSGRLDLAQAEAVIDLIRAGGERARNAAVHQLAGALTQRVTDVRDQLIQVVCQLEVGIDWPEHDEEEEAGVKAITDLKEISRQIIDLMATVNEGRIIREGLRVAIIGKPNVGKSSLLNALAKAERAIVTEFAGTTRDRVEELVEISGIPVRLIDTAGIRETADYVERIGVERARQAIDLADIIVAVVDGSTPLQEEDREVLSLLQQREGCVILNKVDLDTVVDIEQIDRLTGKKCRIAISTISGEGMRDLEVFLREYASTAGGSRAQAEIFINIRHAEALDACQQGVEQACEALEQQWPYDCALIPLREGLRSLGSITGDDVDEEVVNRIFADFCVGK